jgi:hypothetical protein
MHAFVERWHQRRILTTSQYVRWCETDALKWVPLTKQVSVQLHDHGVFAGGPSMYKAWAKKNRKNMVSKAVHETGLDANQVEVNASLIACALDVYICMFG